MSDRRRRYRKPKDDKRSSGGLSSQFKELEVQPKILLKSKAEHKADTDTHSTSSYANVEPPPISVQVPQKTVIFQKATTQSPALSPNITREHHQPSVASNENTVPVHIVEPVYQMSRPATVISSTGAINAGTKKLLMKSNTDFFVVGVAGTQGVGKSTVLNLLANEQVNFNYYRKVFEEEDSIFPTKLKLNKCSARSRTESTHMFITSDRMIILDTSPVQSNAYKKDMINNELEDIDGIITLMSVCHLLIVVQDDYFNLNFLNLLRFAELMKPSQEVKPFLHDYFPNVLFVKNRAKRLDFAPTNQACLDQTLRAFFRDSKLRIYKGQTSDHYPALTQQSVAQKSKKTRFSEMELMVNSFLLPEVTSEKATAFHNSLADIVEQFRNQVFTTPRNPMYSGPTELTEEMWFDWLSKVSQDNHNFFFNTYEDIQRKHLDAASNGEKKSSSCGVGGGGGGGGGGGRILTSADCGATSSRFKDVDNWRE